MSAAIIWEPVDSKRRRLRVGAPSAFLAKMERAFGDTMPMTLSEEKLPMLRGMAAMVDGEENPYQELIDIIESNGAIRLRAEY